MPWLRCAIWISSPLACCLRSPAHCRLARTLNVSSTPPSGGDVQLLAGRYVHDLETTAAGLRIRHKLVELVNRTEPFFNLSFVL